MTIFVTVLHVLVCLILIVVVLLQRGKGAEVGAVFGGGGSSTVFGSRGAGNFLTRLTSGAAIIFMVTSLVLAYFANEDARSTLFEGDEPVAEESSPFEETGAPAAPEEPAPGSPFEEAPAPPGEATGGFEEVTPPAEPGAPADAGTPAPGEPSAGDAAGGPGGNAP
jgi:preprotein translocase subunit SecG